MYVCRALLTSESETWRLEKHTKEVQMSRSGRHGRGSSRQQFFLLVSELQLLFALCDANFLRDDSHERLLGGVRL